jgi:hypothetical protein
MQELSIMARPSFVKPSVPVLTILCLFQLLAATEAVSYHAKVRVVNNSTRDIQRNSTYITHRFRDISANQLSFPRALGGNGWEDDGDGTQIVDYELVGRNNRWFVTWVFEETMDIQMSDPSSPGCFLHQMNLLGPDIIRVVESIERGATICGFPPTCSHPPPNAAAGAAVATEFISKELLNSQTLCGFQPFELTLQDSIAYSPDNWVTITIQPQGVLRFQSATSSAEIGYRQVRINSDGVVTLKPSNPPKPRAAGSFGVEIPAISSVA